MARLIPPGRVPARRAMRLLLACVALSAVTAMAACGDDGDSSSATSSTAIPTAETSKLSSIDQLTADQYTALERFYVAGLPLDDLDDVTSPAYKRAVNRVLSACDALDGDDPLLGELQPTCPATAEFLDAVAATRDCAAAGRQACADAFAKAARRARSLVAAGRVSDDAVNATRLAQGCKKALLTPPEAWSRIAALERALVQLARALRTGSREDVAAALKALQAADHEEKEPTARELLDRLRRNCH